MENLYRVSDTKFQQRRIKCFGKKGSEAETHPYLTHGGGGSRVPTARPADHKPGLRAAPRAKLGEPGTSPGNSRSELTVGLAGFKKQKSKWATVSGPAYSLTVGNEAQQ